MTLYPLKFFPGHFAIIGSAVLLLLSGCSSVPTTSSSDNNSVTKTQPTSLSPAEAKLLNEAQNFLQQDDLAAAQSILEKMSKRNPKAGLPLANLGLVYFKLNELEPAHSTLKKAAELEPNIPQVYNMLANVELELGKLKEAESNYKKAIALKKDYVEAYYNLALLYDNYYQDIEESISYYKQYLELVDHKDEATVSWVEQLVATINNE